MSHQAAGDVGRQRRDPQDKEREMGKDTCDDTLNGDSGGNLEVIVVLGQWGPN